MRLTKIDPEIAQARLQGRIFDDFIYYTSTETWTSLAADANATVADSDAHLGVLVINTGDVVNNNEAGVRTTQEILLFAADQPFYIEGLIQYTEVNTDGAAVAFGVADNMAAADFMADGGTASPAVANSGVVIYKRNDETVWRAYCENNGVSFDTQSVQTAGGADYHVLGIGGRAIDGTNFEFTYFMDGLPLTDSNNRPIVHTLAFASATEMEFGVYCKSAGGGASLTVNVDYLGLVAGRARSPFA